MGPADNPCRTAICRPHLIATELLTIPAERFAAPRISRRATWWSWNKARRALTAAFERLRAFALEQRHHQRWRDHRRRHGHEQHDREHVIGDHAEAEADLRDDDADFAARCHADTDLRRAAQAKADRCGAAAAEFGRHRQYRDDQRDDDGMAADWKSVE